MPEEQYRINVNQKYRGFLKEPNWDTMRNDIGYFDGTGAQLLFEKAARKSFYIPIHMTKGYFHSYINKKRLSMPSDDHGHYMHLREDGETVDFRVRKEGVSTEEFFRYSKGKLEKLSSNHEEHRALGDHLVDFTRGKDD